GNHLGIKPHKPSWVPVVPPKIDGRRRSWKPPLYLTGGSPPQRNQEIFFGLVSRRADGPGGLLASSVEGESGQTDILDGDRWRPRGRGIATAPAEPVQEAPDSLGEQIVGRRWDRSRPVSKAETKAGDQLVEGRGRAGERCLELAGELPIRGLDLGEV